MNTESKILLIDIETTPLEAYSWGPKWETNLIEFIEHTRILSFSAKWLGGKHITKGWPDYKGYKKKILDDKAITEDVWKLLDEADIVIAQNGKSFDIKIMNARFAFHKLTPPSQYKVIDTKLEARKYIRLPSYSLDDLCDYFDIGRKMHHEGFPLWTGCMAGDMKAWAKMKKYNMWDVVLLEKIFLKLRPWIRSLNLGIYNKDEVCTRCGSKRLQYRGYQVNLTTRYRRLQCQDCGSWMRSTKNIQERKPLVSV